MKTHFHLKTFKPLSLSLIALFAIGLSSCHKDSGTSISASIMATNAAETAGPQDFFVDNAKVNNSVLAYGQSTNYLTVTGSSATHNAAFKTSATGTLNNSIVLSFKPNYFYTLFYCDDKTIVGSEDDNTVGPPAGQARVRFVNLSTAVKSNVDFTIAGGASIIAGLPYETITDYYYVAAGSNFSLYTSGSSTVLLNIPAALPAGHTYIIYITGTSNATIAYHVLMQS